MAEKLDVTVEVSKETYELGNALTKFVAALKTALEDGWQTGEDLPVVLSSAMADLVPGMQGMDKIGDELAADPQRFYAAIGLTVQGLAKLWAPAPEAEA